MRSLLLSFAGFLFAIQSFAQVPFFEWAKTGQSVGWQECYSITSDGQSNLFVSGSFFATTLTLDNVSLTCFGSNDILLAKFDSVSNMSWAVRAGGNSDDECKDIAADNIGHLFIAGSFTSSNIPFGPDTVFQSGTGTTAFIAMYDTAGNPVWARAFAGFAVVNSVSTDGSGNCYVTGNFDAPKLRLGTDSITSAGSTDVFIAKFDVTGSLEWMKSIGGTGADAGVACDVHHNLLYVTGNSGSAVFTADTFHLPHYLNLDVFLACLDTSGQVRWAKNYGGNTLEHCNTVTTDQDGNAFICGEYNSALFFTGDDTLAGTGGLNAFLIKVDSAGHTLWMKNVQGVGNSTGYAVQPTATGVYFAGGFNAPVITIDTATVHFPSNGYDPMFIARYDTAGNLQWTIGLPSGGDDRNDFAFCSDNTVYAAGDFYNVSPFILGCDTLLQTSTENIFFGKLGYQHCADSIPPTGIEPVTGLHTIIYFDPVNQQLIAGSPHQDTSDLVVYDLLSHEIIHRNFNGSIFIDTHDVAKGTYYYELRSKEGLLNGKIIIN